MIQCRYGTNGNYCKKNNQPCTENAIDGTKITVAHNGEFVGLEEYKDNSEVSDTRVFVKLLAKAEGKNWDEKIINVLEKMKGSFSLIIGIGDVLYVSRDSRGIRPLLINKIKDGWMVASETTAFTNTGDQCLDNVKEVLPGEILKINGSILNKIKKGNRNNKAECIFEFPYTRSPQSLYCNDQSVWESIYKFRERSGYYLAKQFKKLNLDVDFLIGIPESGLPIAEGFSNASKIPMKNVIIKKPSQYYLNLPTRTFMDDKNIKNIPSEILKKLALVPDKKIYKGKRIACIDDSVVRSSTSKVIVKALLDLGAKSVDWISGLPMVINSCHLGISIRSKEELIAFQKKGDVKKIAKEMGARNVVFITPENIIRAANGGSFIRPKKDEDIFMVNGFCGGCLGGKYPVKKNEKVKI